jgi:hypothetical protein
MITEILFGSDSLRLTQKAWVRQSQRHEPARRGASGDLQSQAATLRVVPVFDER